jgi:hypothetical protein
MPEPSICVSKCASSYTICRSRDGMRRKLPELTETDSFRQIAPSGHFDFLALFSKNDSKSWFRNLNLPSRRTVNKPSFARF